MINPFIIHHAIGGVGGGVADRIIDGPIYKTVKANDSVRTWGKNAFHILIEEEELLFLRSAISTPTTTPQIYLTFSNALNQTLLVGNSIPFIAFKKRAR